MTGPPRGNDPPEPPSGRLLVGEARLHSRAAPSAGARSSNGRTGDSGSPCLGSNPSRARNTADPRSAHRDPGRLAGVAVFLAGMGHCGSFSRVWLLGVRVQGSARKSRGLSVAGHSSGHTPLARRRGGGGGGDLDRGDRVPAVGPLEAGVDVRGQPRVRVTEELLGEREPDALAGEEGREGRAERVEVDDAGPVGVGAPGVDSSRTRLDSGSPVLRSPANERLLQVRKSCQRMRSGEWLRRYSPNSPMEPKVTVKLRVVLLSKVFVFSVYWGNGGSGAPPRDMTPPAQPPAGPARRPVVWGADFPLPGPVQGDDD